MRILKHHTIEPNWKQLPYNTLGGCLEAHFGNKQESGARTPLEYQEPDQGFHTVMFKSLPLQMNYMRRRKSSTRR